MTFPVYRHARAARRPFAFTIAACAALSSAIPAQADDKSLAPVVVTATRTPQIAVEVLSDNVVITSEDIARSGQTSLVDLLQRQRGVEITRNGGPGAVSSVFVRGTENKQSIVLIDGVRVGSATSGGATWSAIPLSQIDRIEIVYGPMSSLYGADAMGGVIQIFTKKGDGQPKPTAMAGVGTYGQRNVEAGISGSSDRISYAFSASHEKSDGFNATRPGAFAYNPDSDGYKRDSASGRFSFELAKGHEIGLNFMRSRINAQYDGSTTEDDRTVQNIETTALFSRNRLAPNWSSQLQFGLSKDLGETFPLFPSRFDTKQTFITWQNDVTLGSDLLQLVLERRREEADTTTTALNRERTTNSLAAAYQLKRGAHLTNLSVRNDNSSQFGSNTTGSLAYGYRITGALRANASIGTSFRAPTFNELYYPGFGFAANKPEKGRNAEVGLYYDDGKTQLSAVYYHNRITDLIVTARPCPATGTSSCSYNVNEALLTGLTLGGSTRYGNFVFRGSLDLQDPRDETTGKRLARRAKQHGTLVAEYAAGKTSAGAELVFSGERFDDVNNTNRLGGYGLLNLYASYDVTRDWSVFGRWNNVLDKDYELARTYTTEGSSVFVGVRYGFR